MTVNKHAAIQEWLSACPLLSDALIFDALNEIHGSVSVVPVTGDTWVKRYVRETGFKAYTFALTYMLKYSETTDDTNTGNLYLCDLWRVWLEEQQAAGNYPDFGANCSDYSIENLSNMAQLAERYDSDLAKYMLQARVNYYQKGA